MPATDLFQTPYPGYKEDPFWESFQAMVRSQDASLFWVLEQSRFQFIGGGTVGWNGATLSWSQTIYIVSPQTGVVSEIPAGSLAVADGQFVTTAPVAGAKAANLLTLKTEQSAAVINRSVVVAYRRGTDLLLRGSVMAANAVVSGFAQRRSDNLDSIFDAGAPGAQVHFYRTGSVSGAFGLGRLSVGTGESSASTAPARAAIPIGPVDPWTLTYWIRTTAVPFVGQQFKAWASGGPSVTIASDANKIGISIKDDAGSDLASASSDYVTGAFGWNMVALVMVPGNAKLYINGAERVGVDFAPYASSVGADRLDFLSDPTSPSDAIKVADLRGPALFREALSAAEIAALYEARPAHDLRFKTGAYTKRPNFYWTGPLRADGVQDVGSDTLGASLVATNIAASSDQDELSMSRVQTFSTPLVFPATPGFTPVVIDGLDGANVDRRTRGELLFARFMARIGPTGVTNIEIYDVSGLQIVNPVAINGQIDLQLTIVQGLWRNEPIIMIDSAATSDVGSNTRLIGSYVRFD